MVKKGIGFLFILLTHSMVSGQSYDQIIDSLWKELHAHPDENEKRVDLLNELSYAFRRNSPAKIDSFARAANALAQKLNYSKGIGIAHKNLGISTYKLGGETDTVIAYYQKCFELSREAKDYYSQAACANNIGLSYRSQLRYTRAIEKFQEAYDIHEKNLPVDRLRMLIIGNIGKSYSSMDDYENGRKYLEQVIALAEEYENEAIRAMYTEDYALVMYKQGKVEEATKAIIQNLPKLKKLGDYQSYVQSLNTLSSILIQEGQFEKAERFVKQGLEAAEQYHFPFLECEIKINQSKVLFEKERLNEALEVGEAAFECANDRKETLELMKAAKNLMYLYLASDNLSKARGLYPIYNDLVERHFDTEQQKTYAALEIQYQNAQKEAEYKLLKAQQLENEVTIQSQRFLGWTLFFIGLLAVGVTLFAYRSKKTQNNLLEQKVKERTEALSKSYQELEHSNQELERSNEELERFAYVASHDLKQPLNTVICFSGLMNDKLQETLDPETQSYLDFVRKGSDQMKRLIEDILEYSKLGEENRAEQILDLNELVDEVTLSISELIERKNAQVNIVGNLPSLKQEKTKMVLLLKNLIENGIKYNQSPIPTIDIQTLTNGRYTRLSFTDNGIGIEEVYFPKLFKMFSRLENSKDYEGTGLGLSLCKKIVNNMGGIISIESAVGKGSTFHVDIPNEVWVSKEAVTEFSEV